MTMTRTALWLAFGLTLAIACSASDDHAPGLVSAGGAEATGGSEQLSGGAHPMGGFETAGDFATPSGGSGGEAGLAELPGGGVPNFEPPLCDALNAFGDSESVAVGDDGDLRLLAITPDELTIAYALGTGDGSELRVADRATADDDFPEGDVVPVSDDLDFSEGATLSADGRSLVLPREDRRGFAELDRASREHRFTGSESDTRFQRLDIEALMSAWQCGYPLLSFDDQSLYFVRTFGTSLVMLSTLGQDGQFASALAIDEYTLGGTDDGRKLLSGLSSDERTIFVYDEATAHSAVLTRSRPGGPFYDPVDFGERRGLAPNLDCTALYSSEKLSGSWRLVRQLRAP